MGLVNKMGISYGKLYNSIQVFYAAELFFSGSDPLTPT
jgi:hypothetical protein